ncbi:hypothetical protein PoB_007230600 [Plakobranchus ocellatus]|uniref:Uncharacterized protein n=1 Tax=Plakobranchus ocellatus TaxID=259542 RepID=A0AAV4DNW1_9GAST|nr:hypothetical protein PoB_007230600 [Plakobranchus ocellatus]
MPSALWATTTLPWRNALRADHTSYYYVDVMKSARKTRSPFTNHHTSRDFFMEYSEISSRKTLRSSKQLEDPTVTDAHCFQYTLEANGEIPVHAEFQNLLKYYAEYMHSSTEADLHKYQLERKMAHPNKSAKSMYYSALGIGSRTVPLWLSDRKTQQDDTESTIVESKSKAPKPGLTARASEDDINFLSPG